MRNKYLVHLNRRGIHQIFLKKITNSVYNFIGIFQACKLNIYWQVRAFTRLIFLITEFSGLNCKVEKTLLLLHKLGFKRDIYVKTALLSQIMLLFLCTCCL